MGLSNKLFIKRISINDLNQLEEFLFDAGTSLQTFRYFNKRELSVIKNHIITCLLFLEDKPIAYGHLDSEDGVVWLGIAVAEGMQGHGFGSKVMDYLVQFAMSLKLKRIKLSVDCKNKPAISMYEKFGFYEDSKSEFILFMTKELDIENQ